MCLAPWSDGVAGPIERLLPGHWYEVPDSRLVQVAPRPVPPGSTGVDSVIDAWGGGAYDTKRDRLIVWGGGHGNYAGNEVYVFDVKALRWQRLTEPSTDVGGEESTGYYPDGKPRSRHTYGFIEYIPDPVDRFCAFGAGGTYPSSSISVPNVDCFDFDSGKWERRADAPEEGTSTRIGSKAAYDRASGRVFLQTGLSGTLSSYEPVEDKWRIEAPRSYMPYETTMAIDHHRRVAIAVGGGSQYVVDLRRPAGGFRPLKTTGETAVTKATSPGLAYDPVGKQFVAWAGGSDVYLLRMDELQWRKVPARNRVSPGSPAAAGTFGRFRYVASRDVFILVNSARANVFVYRLDRRR